MPRKKKPTCPEVEQPPDSGGQAIKGADGVAPNTFKSIEQSQGRAAAIQHLKDHGITWKEDAHEGINWMRACMAANKTLSREKACAVRHE